MTKDFDKIFCNCPVHVKFLICNLQIVSIRDLQLNSDFQNLSPDACLADIVHKLFKQYEQIYCGTINGPSGGSL